MTQTVDMPDQRFWVYLEIGWGAPIFKMLISSSVVTLVLHGEVQRSVRFPNNSFIAADSFSSVKEFADRLIYLDNNNTELARFVAAIAATSFARHLAPLGAFIVVKVTIHRRKRRILIFFLVAGSARRSCSIQFRTSRHLP